MRKTSGRWLDGSGQRSFTRRQDRRDPNADGQTVSNWVDALAPALIEHNLPRKWPREFVVDSVEFRVNGGQKASARFYVFVAVGYTANVPKSVTWKMQAFGSKTQRAWKEFFRSLEGRPQVLISDMDSAIRAAAKAVFRAPGAAPTELHLCEWHLKRRIAMTLQPLQGRDPQSKPLKALDLALTSPARWSELVDAVEEEDLLGTPLPGARRWLKRYGASVALQTQARGRASVHSTAAAEKVISDLRSAFAGRSSVFGNRRRVNLVLGLMTLALRGRADEVEWAEQIRSYLSERGGHAPKQGLYNDPLMMPSVFVP